MESIFLSPISLTELTSTIEDIIDRALARKRQSDLKEKLLSPEETCKLFHPPISKVTLPNWEKQGKVNKHYLGGRVVYKYTEVLEALKTVKRYRHLKVLD